MVILQDLLHEESDRINGEINATMTSFRTHYNDSAAQAYNITEVILGLRQFNCKNKTLMYCNVSLTF